METENEKREEQEGKITHSGEDTKAYPETALAAADSADAHDHEDEHNGDGEDDDHRNDHEAVDYAHLSKQQIVALVKDLSKSDDFRNADRVLREVKPVMDEMREKERAAAWQKFAADGGEESDFEYRGDESDQAFDAYVKIVRDRRAQYFREQEDRKLENLRRKEDLLERLREHIDSNDTSNPFEAFKELQKEWKSIGEVPGPQAKTLWANYHALVDRFYDNQSIYFELKELDRKKNLEAKLELCVRAEKLADVGIIKDAIRELNELHHEFKHIGPVPMDEKDAVWQRFKAASDAVYARRDEYLQTLQSELNENLGKKQALCDEVLPFATFNSDRIKEWNQKTKEILDTQKRWEVIGGLPRAKAKEVNKKFWSAFKQFFNNKNTFFKKLDEEREQNLARKNELVEQARALKESTDWEATSNALKDLQVKWKEVGPVPEKFREKVFQEFKEACDFFFEQRRSQHGKSDQQQAANMEQKVAICAEMEADISGGEASAERLKAFQQRYNEIGFVPRKDLNAIRNRFNELVEKYVAAMPAVSDEERAQIMLESQLDGLRNDPNADKKIYQKEQAIRKKITKVENDIAVWRNNLEFFGRSQNAEKYKEEFNEKIQEATDHLQQLKQQLRILRTV